MKVIVFAPSGSIGSALEQLSLEQDDVLVVACSTPDAPVRTRTITPSLGGAVRRAENAIGRSTVGRNLLRLTPLDAGRRFAAAVKRSAALRSEIREVDLIVVLERDGLLAGWHAVRRAEARTRAVYGIAAAQAVIATLRAARASEEHDRRG